MRGRSGDGTALRRPPLPPEGGLEADPAAGGAAPGHRRQVGVPALVETPLASRDGGVSAHWTGLWIGHGSLLLGRPDGTQCAFRAGAVGVQARGIEPEGARALAGEAEGGPDTGVPRDPGQRCIPSRARPEAPFAPRRPGARMGEGRFASPVLTRRDLAAESLARPVPG